MNVVLNISNYIIKLFDIHIDISWLVFLISCKKIVAVFCLLLSLEVFMYLTLRNNNNVS